MTLKEAMVLLELNEEDMSIEVVKKKFKSKIKIYHPDTCRDDETRRKFTEMTKELNEAKELVIKLLEEVKYTSSVKNNSDKVYRIKFSDYIKLINGSKVLINRDGKKISIDKSNRYQINLGVVFEWNVEIEGEKLKFSESRIINREDKYEIHCDIPVKSLDNKRINVEFYGKNIGVDMVGAKVTFNIKIDGVCINLSVIKNLRC